MSMNGTCEQHMQETFNNYGSGNHLESTKESESIGASKQVWDFEDKKTV